MSRLAVVAGVAVFLAWGMARAAEPKAGGAESPSKQDAPLNRDSRSELPLLAKRCAVPEGDGLKVDANTGEVLGGSLRISEGETLRVRFVGKNPFKYVYRFPTTLQAMDSAVAAQYLRALPLPANAVFPIAGDVKSLDLPAYPDECTEDQGVGRNFINALERLVSLEVEFTTSGVPSAAPTQRELVEAFAATYDAFFQETDEADFSSTEACLAAVQPAVALLQYQSPPIRADFRSFPADVDALVRDAAPMSAASNNACVAKLISTGALKQPLERLQKSRDSVERTLQRLQLAEQGQAMLRNLQQDATAFHDVRAIAVPGEPTSVRIQLFRTNRRQVEAAEQKTGELALQAGRGLLSVSAGVVYSTLNYKTYGRQQRLVNGQLETVLAATEASEKGSFFPAVLLHARLAESPGGDVGVHASLGIVGAADGVEYVLGVTGAAAQQRVLLTVGVHGARREELSGFVEGDPVPPGLTDPLPTQTVPKFGFAVALTFRL
jgi:hypothetical protein